ncbi:MAG: ATP-binding cassette domain-containing protein, partial [Sutterella parvirubra]|nr:ATP-binding cassette domain-containing protein [Sutterella parvirubra]
MALDLEARIPADGITVLRGDSGSGKTTIADLLAGRIRPDKGFAAVGDVVFTDTEKGIHLPVHERGIGYVFQTHRLLPHLTVRENLEFPVNVNFSQTGTRDPPKIHKPIGFIFETRLVRTSESFLFDSSKYYQIYDK